jgi:hypothetical protein
MMIIIIIIELPTSVRVTRGTTRRPGLWRTSRWRGRTAQPCRHHRPRSTRERARPICSRSVQECFFSSVFICFIFCSLAILVTTNPSPLHHDISVVDHHDCIIIVFPWLHHDPYGI